MGKVCCVSLSDVGYGGDFGRQLALKGFIYYAECRGVGRPINFWFFGDNLKIKGVLEYAYRNYNRKFRKVVTVKGVDWKQFMGSLDDLWCDRQLTMCTLDDFYDIVRVVSTSESVSNGRNRPIVPYEVELTLGDEEMNYSI